MHSQRWHNDRWLIAIAAERRSIGRHLAFVPASFSEQARARALSGKLSFPTVAHPAFITMSLRE
jgi:hypothetical protein